MSETVNPVQTSDEAERAYNTELYFMTDSFLRLTSSKEMALVLAAHASALHSIASSAPREIKDFLSENLSRLASDIHNLPDTPTENDQQMTIDQSKLN